MWMIQKIGVGDDGEISTVEWQRADTGTNAWVGLPEVVPVLVVVDAVLVGKVGSVLPIAGGTVQGPYVRTVVGPNGIEGIVADPSDGETRSLFDLPKL